MLSTPRLTESHDDAKFVNITERISEATSGIVLLRANMEFGNIPPACLKVGTLPHFWRTRQISKKTHASPSAATCMGSTNMVAKYSPSTQKIHERRIV